MARKTTIAKETRARRYDNILRCPRVDGTPGVRLSDCIVIGFRFPTDTQVVGFHYAMLNAHIDCLLFDRTGTDAIVIFQKDSWNPETADVIRMIAECRGGVEFKPNMDK